MAKTYDEIVKALAEELGAKATSLEMFEDSGRCRNCGEDAHLGLMGRCYFICRVCADRPACRARAKRQREERERAVCEAVTL